jgi:hypothetical protein
LARSSEEKAIIDGEIKAFHVLSSTTEPDGVGKQQLSDGTIATILYYYQGNDCPHTTAVLVPSSALNNQSSKNMTLYSLFVNHNNNKVFNTETDGDRYIQFAFSPNPSVRGYVSVPFVENPIKHCIEPKPKKPLVDGIKAGLKGFTSASYTVLQPSRS